MHISPMHASHTHGNNHVHLPSHEPSHLAHLPSHAHVWCHVFAACPLCVHPRVPHARACMHPYVSTACLQRIALPCYIFTPNCEVTQIDNFIAKKYWLHSKLNIVFACRGLTMILFNWYQNYTMLIH